MDDFGAGGEQLAMVQMGSVRDAPFAGIELGGTKCVCTLAFSHDRIVEQRVVATTTPEQTLGELEHVLGQWHARSGLRSLGIASFGPLDLDPASPGFGCITTTPKPGWAGTDLGTRLARRFDVPFAIDTDVNGAALAELRWGAGTAIADLAYVTVGTGIGVGLIVAGQPVHGFGHPELGHVRVVQAQGDEWAGACPFHGACVEGLASGMAIAARLAGRAPSDVSPDDPIWTAVASALAQLCHFIACSTAPRMILVGGGVIEGQPHLLSRIESMLVDSLAGYIALPPGGSYVRAPRLGAMAGPLGAIALAMDAATVAGAHAGRP